MNSHAIIEAEKEARNGILRLSLLGLAKLIAGLVTGMTVIIADAIATFSDTLGVFASYIGLKLSRKSADKHFEFGYYKIETFAALLISLGIIYIGYAILKESIEGFFVVKEGFFRSFGLTITIFSIFFSFKLYKRFKKAGEKANSLSLIVNAKDKKMDMFAGIGVLISIIANYRELPYVEAIVSIIISLIILKVGLFSTKESLFFLLDYWNDEGLNKKIKKLFNKQKDLFTLKKLKMRRAGTFIFGEAFVEVNPFLGIQDLRETLNFLQEKIKKENEYIKDFSIFTHIPEATSVKVAIPVSKGKDLTAQVANNLRTTKGYIFANVKDNKNQNFYYRKITSKEKKPLKLSKFLSKEKVNVLIDNNLSSLVYYNLKRTHHILIYPNFSDIKEVKSTLKLLSIDT